MSQQLEKIHLKGRELGFAQLGVARPSILRRDQEYFDQYIADGTYGTMQWISRNREKRLDPTNYWRDVRSVLVCASDYTPSRDPLENLGNRDKALISVYAQELDYHSIIRQRLERLSKWMEATFNSQQKICIDTSPVLERSLAAQTAVGWVGKHGNLVSRRHGSWLFLSEVLTDLDLPFDDPSADACGSCRRCVDACPTDALSTPYKLKVTSCLAYLNNEHKGEIPLKFRKAMGNRLFGCDDCLAVCPWNKFAKSSQNLSRALPDYDLQDMIQLKQDTFAKRFKGTALKRLGYSRFMRNLLIVVANNKRRDLIPAVKQLTNSDDELISSSAKSSLQELQSS